MKKEKTKAKNKARKKVVCFVLFKQGGKNEISCSNTIYNHTIANW